MSAIFCVKELFSFGCTFFVPNSVICVIQPLFKKFKQLQLTKSRPSSGEIQIINFINMNESKDFLLKSQHSLKTYIRF